MEEQEFIRLKIKRLLDIGQIRKSYSTWRSQIEVVKDQGKWKMLVNYTQTVNKQIQDGVIGMEGFEESINKLKDYKFYARVNFKDWHHLVRIHLEDIEKTAFEANNGHLNFCTYSRAYQMQWVPSKGP